jgi:hypothetical protein
MRILILHTLKTGNTVDGIDFSTGSEVDAVKNGRVYEILILYL